MEEKITNLENNLNELEKNLNTIKNQLSQFEEKKHQNEEILEKLNEFKNQIQKENEKMKNQFESQKKNLEEILKKIQKTKNLTKISEKKNILNEEEITELQNLIQKELNEIIYQGSFNGFLKKNLYEEILNKEKLLFLIEDDDNNIFGCFISSKIENCEEENFAKGIFGDKEFFIFSLKLKGEKNVKKYIKKEHNYCFWTFGDECENLFSINGFITIVENGNLSSENAISGNFQRDFGSENFLKQNSFLVKDILVFTTK